MVMSQIEQDPSASTGRFKAFVERSDAENPSPWRMRAPASRVLLLAGAVVLAAIIIAVLALALAG